MFYAFPCCLSHCLTGGQEDLTLLPRGVTILLVSSENADGRVCLRLQFRLCWRKTRWCWGLHTRTGAESTSQSHDGLSWPVTMPRWMLVPWHVAQGGVVYRQKKRGEEARGFTTVRGTPQNGDGRTCVRQAEPQEILCYAMRVSDLGSLFVFFEGFG